MPTSIPAFLRRLVSKRAANRCEYCRFPQALALHSHEPDHIVPRQHGGVTDESNLALACFRCNRFKGPNAGSFDPLTGTLVPFFDPRNQRWEEHFGWDGALVQPRSPEARVTVKILRLNDLERVSERKHLMACDLF